MLISSTVRNDAVASESSVILPVCSPLANHLSAIDAAPGRCLELTSRRRWVIRAHMNAERSRPTTGCAPRWLSVFLLLTVFFLPLHFHVVSAAASQVTKECSCLHGSRTHAGLTSATSLAVPLIAVSELALVAQVNSGNHSIRIPSSRAPPHTVSR
jgi:hypothetical protein